jgi:hypothetical protein
MIRFVVGGQFAKENIAELVRKVGGDQVEVSVMQDTSAAVAIKSGKSDFYLGACNTGGGGALALAIAILGMSLCQSLSMPGRVCSEEEIVSAVRSGKKAFGMTDETVGIIVPLVVKATLESTKSGEKVES